MAPAIDGKRLHFISFPLSLAKLSDAMVATIFDVRTSSVSGFQVRIRCHDLHGTLPEIAIENSGDAFYDKDRLGNEVCKMIAIVRLRDELVRFLPGSSLLSPTSMDGKAIVGLQAKPRTWIAEGESFLAAYHELHRKVVG
jgi:hypothetical protein